MTNASEPHQRTNSLQHDLQTLDRLAFQRRRWSQGEIKRYHTIWRKKGKGLLKAIDLLYEWMFVPVSLWPFSVQDVFASCLERISAAQQLDKEMRLLLKVLPAPPSEQACAVVALHEHEVQRGYYEGLVTTTAKFNGVEKALSLDPALKLEWEQIKKLWDIAL